jgi:hypothetical protein
LQSTRLKLFAISRLSQIDVGNTAAESSKNTAKYLRFPSIFDGCGLRPRYIKIIYSQVANTPPIPINHSIAIKNYCLWIVPKNILMVFQMQRLEKTVVYPLQINYIDYQSRVKP